MLNFEIECEMFSLFFFHYKLLWWWCKRFQAASQDERLEVDLKWPPLQSVQTENMKSEWGEHNKCDKCHPSEEIETCQGHEA